MSIATLVPPLLLLAISFSLSLSLLYYTYTYSLMYTYISLCISPKSTPIFVIFIYVPFIRFFLLLSLIFSHTACKSILLTLTLALVYLTLVIFCEHRFFLDQLHILHQSRCYFFTCPPFFLYQSLPFSFFRANILSVYDNKFHFVFSVSHIKPRIVIISHDVA